MNTKLLKISKKKMVYMPFNREREGGGGLFQISTESLILFYLWTDLILNKIQKRTSVVVTRLW